MPYPVVITTGAEQDTTEAYLYYEELQDGLGERFLEELGKRYNDISNHPTHYSFINEDPRKVLRDVALDKFPFVVVYKFDGNDVLIIAVHNTYKHQSKKTRGK